MRVRNQKTTTNNNIRAIDKYTCSILTDERVKVVNKPTFLEVSDGEVLSPIATNILIELSPTSPVLPKTPTMEHLPSNDTTYFQHQIDLLFKNFINKKLAHERAHKDDEAKVSYEKIKMFEKENQCLKNEIKNQQAVIDMLITNYKCADKWKTEKTKSKNSINIA